VELVSRVSPDLPEAAADRDALLQVLINLTSNALKFTPPGGSVTVDAAYLAEGEIWKNSPELVSGLVLSVTDTGKGIPEDQLETIFNRFKQLEKAAWGKPVGSGLGLSICRAIVQNHGGIIWAESQLGKGSSFHFTLNPAGEEALKERTALPAAA